MQHPEQHLEEALHQFIIFRLNRTEFAVPIEQVTRILRPVKCTRVPRAPAFLEGIINLHGDIVPVIDLAKRLQMAAMPHDDETRIIVAEVDNQRVGMVVDSVTEILSLPQTAIESPPGIIAKISDAYLTGVAVHDDRLFVILDLGRVLTTEELADLHELQTAT